MSQPRRRPRATPPGELVPLERARIERALRKRSRYRYVQPRVVREGKGWKIVSPNCSRAIDPQGGEIDIVWFEPAGAGRWALHARDHAAGAWLHQATGLALDDALHIVCADPLGRYWP